MSVGQIDEGHPLRQAWRLLRVGVLDLAQQLVVRQAEDRLPDQAAVEGVVLTPHVVLVAVEFQMIDSAAPG